MGKIAVVFSGQGAQYTGMGSKLYVSSKAARAIFDKAERLRPGTIDTCFNGDAATLADTANTQPCIFTANLAAFFALTEQGITPDGFAGFSLGEMSAVVACGALGFEDGFKAIMRRAEVMDNCAKQNPGAMAAVIKLSPTDVESLCVQAGVFAANYNSPQQTVVSGAKDKMERFKDLIKEKGGRAIPLPVSGAFHSPFMAKAAAEFKQYLTQNSAAFKNGHMQLYSNLTALPYGGDFAGLLSGQIDHPVRWNALIENMIASGYDTFIEAGVGSTLCGLISKINAGIKTFKAESADDISAITAALI